MSQHTSWSCLPWDTGRAGFLDPVQQRAHVSSACPAVPNMTTPDDETWPQACGFRHCNQKHVSPATMSSRIHETGVADVMSISAVCGIHIQGFSVPSFGHDLETERRLIGPSLISSRRSEASVREFTSMTSRAAEFTIRIKSQIIRAIMEGRCPILVCMGTNAMSHN